MDFTLKKYRSLIKTLTGHHDFFMRHDVDVNTRNALTLARIEAELGIKTTYYFRAKHFTSPKNIPDIQAIIDLGHNIGFHYESLSTCNGNIELAYNDFVSNLETLRQIAPVSTACSHGSPTSPWDSQTIWQQHDIHALGIDYEPMIDTDFMHTLYLTDTGRRWDGYRVSIRDKVPHFQEKWNAKGLSFHSTDNLISALNNTNHPIHSHKLLINIHPERWITFGSVWTKEVCLQWLKNIIKHIFITYYYNKKQ